MEAGAQRSPHDELRAQLERLIADETGTSSGAPHVTGLRRITGGLSRETWSFGVTTSGDAVPRPCILMRSAVAGVLDTDRVREFHLLRALRTSGVPVPEALWLDPDGRWLERPAFVMSRVDGSTDRRPLGRGRTGAAQAIDEQFLQALVTLHAFPVAELGPALDGGRLPDPGTVALEQVARWETALHQEDLDRHPALVHVLGWLRERAPVAERVGLVHGDYRYGNFLHDGHHITAILDWEEAHVGDPVEDIPWPFRPFRRGTEPLLAYPDWVRAYEHASGTTVDRFTLAWYRVLAELKCAAIYLTGLRSFRALGGHDLSLAVPGQLIPFDVHQALLWIDEIEAGALGKGRADAE